MSAATAARTARLLAGLLALALVLVACGGGEDDPSDPDAGTEEASAAPTDDPDAGEEPVDTVEGGTVVWAYDQEPLILNPTLSDGSSFATAQIALATLLPLWVITPEFTYEPSPLLEDAEVNQSGDSFSVTYTLTDEAEWSDGTPITAGDVFFTLETCLNEEWAITTRSGCDAVDMEATEAALDPSSKTIEVVFSYEYAPWQTLFSTADLPILPSHILEGEDWNTVWNDEIPIASGPFRFESWEKGQQLTLVRNESYFGEPASLDRVVFRFLPDSASQVQALRGGEVDMLQIQPQLDLVDQLEAIDGVDIQIAPGPVWEHIDFQHEHPLLGELFVRQAIAMSIDREAIVEQLIQPLYPEAEPLNSIVYVNNQAEYEDHFSELMTYDPDGAVALLEENGCERGDDGIFTCDGERLSFEYTTTAGNERRELTFEILQQQLAEVGIELVANIIDPAIVFSDQVHTSGNFDMIAFAWVGAPDPKDNIEVYRCGGEQNYTGHCNEEASELMEQTNFTTDPEERAALMNEAGALLAQDLPILPLYQLPVVVASHSNTVTGLQVNTTQWGLVWNITEWQAVAD